MNKASTPDCPSTDDLRLLAAGLCSDSTATRLIQHAVTCDHCGALLRIYTEDFADDVSPEDQAVLQSLESNSEKWQTKTARQMLSAGGVSSTPARAAQASEQTSEEDADAFAAARLRPAAAASPAAAGSIDARLPAVTSSTKPGRKPLFWKWAVIPVTAAVAVAAFSFWSYVIRDTPEKVEKLLAQAYTERRNLQVRIPYAQHADYHQLRSGEAASLRSSPAALRKAEDVIDSHLNKDPNDATWILLQARLDLLDWRYGPALFSLTKIVDVKVLSSSEFRMTRALALYEKAEVESDPQLYSEVVNLLEELLHDSPNDVVALFNQAVSCEELRSYECAINNYERLLNIDKDPGWKAEVRERLGRIKEKKTLEP